MLSIRPAFEQGLCRFAGCRSGEIGANVGGTLVSIQRFRRQKFCDDRLERRRTIAADCFRRAHASECTSRSPLSRHSGDKYAVLPKSFRVTLRLSDSAFAAPKSRTFTPSPGTSLILRGLRSL
jgi:hypothetical protein